MLRLADPFTFDLAIFGKLWSKFDAWIRALPRTEANSRATNGTTEHGDLGTGIGIGVGRLCRPTNDQLPE